MYRPLVTLLLRIVPHYRVEFLTRLAQRLQSANIDLQVLFGQERPGTEPRSVHLDAPWARRVPNVYRQFGTLELVWQPAFREVGGSDLVVVEQANRLLANYLLQLQRHRGGFQLAYWGHGRNMQQRKRGSVTERLKRKLICEVDWWFAYTEMSKQHVVRAGFPSERISVVNNTVDDESLRAGIRRLAGRSQHDLARELGCRTANVGVFCGTLHRDKRIDFLLRAGELIRESVPDFELLIIGDGPERSRVEAGLRRSWVKYVGPVLGEERARYLRAARVLLMPGLVGLVIVDSFISECPLVTTSYPFHSPEIAYLESGRNGLITANDVATYANTVAWLLRDEIQLTRLRRGCHESAQTYSLNAMVERFAGGIEGCLAQPATSHVMLS